VHLDLTTGDETFTSETVVRFTANLVGAATFVDLDAGDVREITFNGRVFPTTVWTPSGPASPCAACWPTTSCASWPTAPTSTRVWACTGSSTPHEADASDLNRLLGYAAMAVDVYGDPTNRVVARHRMADAAWDRLGAADAGGDRQLVWARHWLGVIDDTADLARARAVVDGTLEMTGLLVDTEPMWTIAEEELAAVLGGQWSPQLKASIVGTRLDVAVPMILEHYGRPAADSAWASSWLLDRVVELFTAGVEVLPGVHELLDVLRAAKVPVALVSSSYRVLVDAVLSHGFDFDFSLAGDEVGHGKPHPEPYLSAAARLGVPAQDCIVLEDSAAGVLAGEAAGCAVVAVPSVPGVTILPRPRTLVRDSLVGLDLPALEALVG